jgi:hypothetical protein
MPPRLVPPTEKGDVVWLPGVVLVTVTVAPLWVALTPAAAQPAVLIVLNRFVARFVVLESVMKVPLKLGVEPLQESEPLLPAVVVQEKLLMVFVGVNVLAPNVVEVAVTALPAAVAVVPTAPKPLLQLLIASRMFAANVVVIELVVKVPAVGLVQPFTVPSLPLVTPIPHE